jgi:PAS domain S-box-containing protein
VYAQRQHPADRLWAGGQRYFRQCLIGGECSVIDDPGVAAGELWASERRFRDVLEGLELIAVDLDLIGTIRFANPFLARLGGWPVNELVGRDWFETFDPPEAVGVRARFLDGLGCGDILARSENWMVTRDGRRRLISWTNTVLRGSAGEVIGAMSIGEDITGRRREEVELRNLVQEQSALRRVATAVAGGSGHDRVFTLVAQEVARLVGVETANLYRFHDAGSATVLAAWSHEDVPAMPPGTVVPLDSDTSLVRVFRTGQPQRIDDYTGITGELAARLRQLGLRSAVTIPIFVGGQLWGAVSAATTQPEPLSSDAEQRIGQFSELVALAIANAEAQEQLRASRARILTAGDEERRRLERNLHDGAQQRLVSLSLALRMIEHQVESPQQTAIAEARAELAAALEDLRELARGIHPAILSDRGLAAALDVLRTRAPVPVDVKCTLESRPPEAVEAAAYYVASEALTNVAKYARARHVDVTVDQPDDQLVVKVTDDGVGGASTSYGSGLRGLTDRIEALGGTLRVTSPNGAGTIVEAAIPIPK